MGINYIINDSKIIDDIKIITPSIHAESRGSIWTSYDVNSLSHLIPDNLIFNHDKFSRSYQNVLRGIHGDNKSWKLVSCIHGSIKQVVVDMREDSKTFMKWDSFDLEGNNPMMILIPPKFGNAFYVRSYEATYHYKLAYEGTYADADEQFTVSWNDKNINIDWGIEDPILSERDSK